MNSNCIIQDSWIFMQLFDFWNDRVIKNMSINFPRTRNYHHKSFINYQQLKLIRINSRNPFLQHSTSYKRNKKISSKCIENCLIITLGNKIDHFSC